MLGCSLISLSTPLEPSREVEVRSDADKAHSANMVRTFVQMGEDDEALRAYAEELECEVIRVRAELERLPEARSQQGSSRWRSNVTRTSMMGIVLFFVALLSLTSAIAARKSTSAPISLISLSAEQPGSRHTAGQKKYSCQRATGGTCFLFDCAEDRGNTYCAVEPGIDIAFGLRMGWHSCECQGDTPCAHRDGTCHANPEESWRQWFRSAGEWAILFALAPILRSGALSVLQGIIGLDHLMGIPVKRKYKMVNFFDLKDWDAVRIESDFTYRWQAVLVSGMKFIGLHAAQPILFFLPFIGYSPYMGWCQFIIAGIVVLNEMLYLLVACAAVLYNPTFLLYGPFSSDLKIDVDDFPRSASCYFAAPAVFIYNMAGFSEKSVWADNFAVVYPAVASVCAWLALFIGLSGHGVMFPALLVGYVFCGMEAVALVIHMLQH